MESILSAKIFWWTDQQRRIHLNRNEDVAIIASSKSGETRPKCQQHDRVSCSHRQPGDLTDHVHVAGKPGKDALLGRASWSSSAEVSILSVTNLAHEYSMV